jgi:fermentation-respiration switch protein FrsA (DUF1100 family)
MAASGTADRVSARPGRARRPPAYWLRLVGVALLGLLAGLVVAAVVVLPPLMASTLLHPPRTLSPVTPAARGLAYEDVTIPAGDVALQGWYIPGSSDAAVVLVHGVPGNRGQLLSWVPALHDAGYHLLLYDQRGQGASGGDVVTYGYLEAADLAAAADFLRERASARAVGALGVSLGGAVVLLGAGQGARVDAVVADSSFADLAALIEEGTPTRMFLIGQLLLGQAVGAAWERLSPLVLWHAERESGLRAAAVRPVEAVTAISPRPLLLIHGLDDRLFTYANSVRLYEAAGDPKELWLVPGGKHGTVRSQQPAEYDRRVVEFFRRALGTEPHQLSTSPPPGP